MSLLRRTARRLAGKLIARTPFGRRTPAPARPRDVVATADHGVLVGLTGLKLAIEPQGRPVLVNHWATWCDGCVEEMGRLVALHERWGKHVDFVGVGWEGFSGGGEPSDWVRAVERIAAEHGATWPTVVFEGSPAELFEGLGLSTQTIPQTFVLDLQGRQVLHLTAPLDDESQAQLDAALSELHPAPENGPGPGHPK